MKKIIHFAYRCLGYFICALHNLFYPIKLKFKPIKEKTILFVAHQDDDVLFFNSFMKKEKPYVVLVSSGFSLTRMREFKAAMKYYGLRFNYHCLKSQDERNDKIESVIKKELARGNFILCCSHSESGEYGHIMHKNVGKAVKKLSPCRTLSTVNKSQIGGSEYELNEAEIEEKIKLFKNVYRSQLFVLEEYGVWVTHEGLTEVKK